MPSSVLWLSGTYAVTLGPILWVICFAASLPPNSTAPIRLAQSQPRNTELSDRDLSTRDYATTAQFYNDLSARAAVSPQSSSTVVAPKTTDSDYFAPSSSPSHKPSLEYVSSNVTILPKSTVEALNATDGPSFTSPTSATLSALSFSTAVGLLHDNAITPALLDVTSDVSSILSQTNSIGLTSSPVSILGTGAQAYRITTIATSLNHSSSTSASSSLTNTIPTLAPTSTSPTNVAALTDGIALGGALLLFSKNAAEVGPNIVKPATKTASLKSLATIQSKLERAFKDLKGVDTGGPCIAKTKRFKPRKRDILSDLQNDFRCAIDSVNSLQIHLNVEDPDPTVVADDLAVVGKWAQELETDEERKDDDDDDETSTTSTTTIKSTKTTTSNLTPQRTMTTSRTSSSVSRKSASRTATVSSGHSFNATCYTGPEYLFPASAAASAAAGSQSVVFKMLDFALSSFFAMDPPVPFPTTIPNSTWVMENSVTISQSELNSGIAQTSQVFPIVSRTTKSPNTIALPSCMGDGSPNFRPTSWCICATSLTYPALQTSGAGIRATANCAYTSLPSSTIDPTSVPNTMATPVPGQNGISQCVYEIVADRRDLPAGTEEYCFCAGGPDVSAASAPLLTHSPTTSGASNVTDCAYTTQPTPGWTPSITTTSYAGTALQSSTSSSRSAPSATLPTCIVACTGPSNGDLDVTCVCLCQTKPYSYYCETGQFSTSDVQKACDPSTCQIIDADSKISNTVGFITSVTPAPSSTPILPSYGFNCTQIEGVMAAGKDPKLVNTCTCNDGSRPSPTISDHTYVCPS